MYSVPPGDSVSMKKFTHTIPGKTLLKEVAQARQV